jgi:hypothetical protein
MCVYYVKDTALLKQKKYPVLYMKAFFRTRTQILKFVGAVVVVE